MWWSSSWTGWLLLRFSNRFFNRFFNRIIVLVVVAWLVVLALHATPTQAPRLIAAVERAWEQGLTGAGGWRAAWDARGQYYIRPGGGQRLLVGICLPDQAAGLAWTWGSDARPVQVSQRGACDVGAWWAVARPGWVL